MYYLQTTKHAELNFSEKFIDTYYGDGSNCLKDQIKGATGIKELERAKELKEAYQTLTKCNINIITLTPIVVTD